MKRGEQDRKHSNNPSNPYNLPEHQPDPAHVITIANQNFKISEKAGKNIGRGEIGEFQGDEEACGSKEVFNENSVRLAAQVGIDLPELGSEKWLSNNGTSLSLSLSLSLSSLIRGSKVTLFYSDNLKAFTHFLVQIVLKFSHTYTR